MTKITATEASRNFSEVLSRAAAGEEIEITRGGLPVAVLGPPKIKLLPGERFVELMESAPPVDDKDFAEDLRRIRKEAGFPPENPWPS